MDKKILKAMYLTYNHVKELYEDANFLLSNGRKERAYTFYHFAFEEAGRFFILFRCLGKYLKGEMTKEELNYKTLKEEGYEHHIKKLNESVLKMFIPLVREITDEELIKLEDLYNSLVSEIPKLNKKKNESIYISFIENDFKSPSQNITNEDLGYIKDLAEIQIISIGKMLPIMPQKNEDLEEYKRD